MLSSPCDSKQDECQCRPCRGNPIRRSFKSHQGGDGESSQIAAKIRAFPSTLQRSEFIGTLQPPIGIEKHHRQRDDGVHARADLSRRAGGIQVNNENCEKTGDECHITLQPKRD